MTRVRNFVADLARAGKGYHEIKQMTDAAYADMALTKSSIYRIIRLVKAGKDTDDQRHQNAKKTKRTPQAIDAVVAAIKEDAQISVDRLAAIADISHGTVCKILQADLGLVKKSAGWVPDPRSRRSRGKAKQRQVDAPSTSEQGKKKTGVRSKGARTKTYAPSATMRGARQN